MKNANLNFRKKIQGLPVRTRSDIAESMIGLYRIDSEIEKQKLMFLHKLLCLPVYCITKEIFVSKYLMYLNYQRSVKLVFIPDICRIIAKYNLNFILNNYFRDSSLPTISAWKNTVRKVIGMREYSLWVQRLNMNQEYMFFQVLQPGIEPSIVYNVSKLSAFRSTLTTSVKLWSRPIALTHCTCSKCGMLSQEELVHLLHECS